MLTGCLQSTVNCKQSVGMMTS